MDRVARARTDAGGRLRDRQWPAAVALAAHFDHVLAVDGSLAQLERATPHPRVRYERAMAEQLPVADASVALVAAAQAAHWFDFARFHAECRRVLRPGGVIAVWTYEKFRATPALDAAIDRFYDEVVGEFWPPERRYVEERYRTLPFPWAEEQAPEFGLETDWSLEQVQGYLASWSAVQRYKDAHGGRSLARPRGRTCNALACRSHGSSQLARPPAAGRADSPIFAPLRPVVATASSMESRRCIAVGPDLLH